MTARDPRCGCPLTMLASNRAERRAGKRAITAVAVHTVGCRLNIGADTPMPRPTRLRPVPTRRRR